MQASEHHVLAFGVIGLINTIKVEKGTAFTYQVSIRSDGPIPVTIKDIGMKGGAVTTHVVAVNSDPYENGGQSRGFMAFAAFRLGPDQEAIIEMEVQVGADACVEGPGFTSWFQEPVTYSMFGITRHSDADAGTEIRLESATEGRAETGRKAASGRSGRRRSRLGRPDCRS